MPGLDPEPVERIRGRHADRRGAAGAQPRDARDRLPQHDVAARDRAVWAAQAERQQKLIQLKRAGEVKELPPIYQYEMPSPCLRDSFPSDQPPASLLGFEGAIWPFED